VGVKAIILAAGVGKRLKPITDGRPKCLVEVSGRTVLDRYFENLGRLGIKRAVIVVGHLKELVMEAVGEGEHGVAVRYLVNDRYREGNILSVQLAAREFDDDILLMDADVIFHPDLLTRLVRSPHENCYLMDEGFIADMGEECKVAALDGRVVANNRKITKAFDRVGEGLGFLKLSQRTAGVLKEILDDLLRGGGADREYEEALEIMLAREWVGFEPVGDLPWVEIDFPEDIAKAERLVARFEEPSR
jgi:choline kinase